MTIKVFLGKSGKGSVKHARDYIEKTFPGRKVYDTDKLTSNILHGHMTLDTYTPGLIKDKEAVLFMDWRFSDLLKDIIRCKMSGEYLRVNFALKGVRKVPVRCDIVILTYAKKSTKEMLQELGVTEFEVIKEAKKECSESAKQ